MLELREDSELPEDVLIAVGVDVEIGCELERIEDVVAGFACYDVLESASSLGKFQEFSLSHAA